MRARPVADAPVEALIARAEELARGWAVALILARPLATMTDIPLEDVARSAPALCEALARALVAEEPIERLAATDSGGAALAPLRALVDDPATLVADVDALRAVLWQATLEELRDPPARLLADLADRLACVCAAVLAATLRARGEGASVPRHARAAPRASAHVPYRSERDAPARAGVVRVDEHGVEPRPLASVDGFEESAPGARDTHAAGAPTYELGLPRSGERESPPEPEPATPRARPWDTPLVEEPAMRVRRGSGARIDEPR